MNKTLDEYIRESHGAPKNNMSLDEYITMKNITAPAHTYNHNHTQNHHDEVDSGPSKFDRYKYQDEDDEMDEDGSFKTMPKLVPYVHKTMPPKKKSVHQRLGGRSNGERGSICESIHTSQLSLFNKNQFKAKRSVQSRLGKGYVNPAVLERNRIALHALNLFEKSAAANMLTDPDDAQGRLLLSAFTKAAIQQNRAIEMNPETTKPKYDMQVQKEISALQGKELYYTCPGAFVVSSDGPGLRGMVKVPSHTTDISMNQRFA